MPQSVSIASRVRAFFEQYPVRLYDEGELIIFGDRTIPSVHYIVKGMAMQYSIMESGSKAVVNSFKQGAFFPMQHAITGIVNEYFYEATTSVKTHVAPYEDVLDFLRREPDVTMDLLTRVLRGALGMEQKMELLMAGTAGARLWRELQAATERFGESQPDGGVRVRFTEVQLAQQTGLARETVSRELQKFKNAHLLTTHRGSIVVAPSLARII
jgi:CRP-like cAMP-binding protein